MESSVNRGIAIGGLLLAGVVAGSRFIPAIG